MRRALPALIALTAAVSGAVPAAADERRVMVTSFDRVRVEGPFTVEVRTGPTPGAIATGDARALDAVEIRLEDRTLVVRGSPNGWGGWPGERTAAPVVAITTPRLVTVSVQGAGTLRAEAMAGQEVSIGLTGSGRIEVARIDADRLEAILAGAGALRLAGSARTARMLNNGVGSIEADGLAVRDLTLQSESAGESRATATRTAAVTATGIGSVTVTGGGACTKSGPAPIVCGP